jgi:hypothetical protein
MKLDVYAEGGHKYVAQNGTLVEKAAHKLDVVWDLIASHMGFGATELSGFEFVADAAKRHQETMLDDEEARENFMAVVEGSVALPRHIVCSTWQDHTPLTQHPQQMGHDVANFGWFDEVYRY